MVGGRVRRGGHTDILVLGLEVEEMWLARFRCLPMLGTSGLQY